MQIGHKYLASEEIKFKNKCKLCNKDWQLKFQKDICPKNNCKKKG